ncbi:hypothetical protein BN1708_016153 [Verticillium longisporum]|uniref:Protamine P1 n=1 Tax=Verticillium longisporum TaxID=100787 RepID=A0A0G4MFB4_VERLO|nr:hypothetical protein HYQ44_016080 [Verticillium longisporum]CRK32740.1 hypothetical protein BN1708_016153 [Verticillium longisporum]
MAAAVPRYRRIGDEPLYCEADPTEALYKGSDDEDYPNPSVRKYKYEAAAVRFLEGKKTFILSATLRGPFDEASGWTNPWQSKGRSKGRSTSSDTPGSGVSYSGISQSVAKLRSIRHSIEDSFTQKATAHASSSCHLPSPESLDRAIQHPYLDEDELVKLESWRSRVAPAKPSIDRFWAPRQASFDSTVLRKRRAQDPGWLKRRAPKRHRTDGDIDDLDDLDTASVLAQGFGMSQNIHQPILPPPEADVEDELNNNIVHNSDNPISPERKSPTRIGILTSPAKANGESDSDDELSGPSQSSQKPRTWRAASTRSQVSSRRQASEARSIRSNASRRFIRQGTATPTAKTVPVVDKDEAPEFETQQDDSFIYRARPKRRASTPGPLPAQQLTSPLSSAPDDISDFTSLGSHDHDAPSVDNHVAVELSSAAEEWADQGNAEVPSAEQSPSQQTARLPQPDEEQALGNIIDDVSFNSSDSECDDAISVDEVIPSSQPAFDSSTLVESTFLESAKRCSKPERTAVQSIENDETMCMDKEEPEQTLEETTASEKSEESDRPPETHDRPRVPLQPTVLAVANEAITSAAVQAEECASDALSNCDMESHLTTDHSGLPVVEGPSSFIERHGNAITSDECSERVQSSVSLVAPQTERVVEEMADLDCLKQCHETPSGGTIAPSRQSPWNGDVKPMQATVKSHTLEEIGATALPQGGSPVPQGSQQTPWKVDEDHTGTALIDAAYIDVVPKETPSTPYSGLDQLRKAAMSAFKTAGLSIMSSFTHEAQNMTEREADSTVSGETDSLHTAPSTPLHRQEEPVLPTATFTLKPFADFTSPEQPARRKSRNARISGGHLPSTQSILLDANINPWGSSPRSNKRVSWGILPYESADASSRADETSTTARRAASPPPEQALDDLPTSQIDPFYKHFSVVKNTVKGHRHRILPTASQQVLRSPSPMAMAEAFVIADELGHQGPGTRTASSDVAEQHDDHTTGHMEDNGSDSGDDVADVLMNLDSFIDAMDVEADVKQAKAETKPVVDQENRNPFSAVASFDAGVWDD